MRLALFFALAGLAPAAAGADWIVGGVSPLTSISQAMSLAAPGDRILVMPGVYPPFHLSKGVSVIGMGANPSEVRVGRVDVHVTVPQIGYEALLSDMTLGDGTPSNVIALSGNEQPPGTLVVSGVRIEGGVFLGGGAQGYYAQFQNVGVEPGPGQGFLGAAVYLGGTAGFAAEFTDCSVKAWDANGATGLPAGVGLKLSGGMRARLTNTTVRGGDGAGLAPAGGDAIAGVGTTTGAWLRLQGTTSVLGGNAAGGAAGGDGVTLSGKVELGAATVTGGTGSPAGANFLGSAPTALPLDPWLQVTPAAKGGATPIAVYGGEDLALSMNTTGPTAIVISLKLNLPPASKLQPLGAPALVWFGNAIAFNVPANLGFEGLFLHAQGFTRPLGGGPLIEGNVQTVRLDSPHL